MVRCVNARAVPPPAAPSRETQNACQKGVPALTRARGWLLAADFPRGTPFACDPKSIRNYYLGSIF